MHAVESGVSPLVRGNGSGRYSEAECPVECWKDIWITLKRKLESDLPV